MEDIGHHTEVGGSHSAGSRPAMISCEDLAYSYAQDPFGLRVPSLSIAKGERVAIIGPSGSGKTTLVNLLAGILSPDSGVISVDSISISEFTARDRADFRIAKLGLIFQEFELLDYLSVVDNILLPYRINPILTMSEDTVERAETLCDRVGLGPQTHKTPKRLSQGERQRVAVCRALITDPVVLLCDEPTANLDPANRDNILGIIFDYCTSRNATLAMVTHDNEMIDRFDRAIDVTQFRS